MAHKLVIVESPAKARTIAEYLGEDYVVESSVGHIRDLPNNAADTPAKIKDQPWGRLAVDVDHGFQPYYVVPRDKKSQISELKKLLKDADELYLATDEDREGEAIAWHLQDELAPKNIPVKRMVFHEITPSAIAEAAQHPREIDMDLVQAQEARRILDRLYGYEVSPVLWRKVQSGLSAGRVQSVATRLVVDRERERMAFRAASYWDLEAVMDAETDAKSSDHDPRTFPAKLAEVDGVRVARGSDFGPDGRLKQGKGAGGERVHLDQQGAERLAGALADTSWEVRAVESKPYKRSPYAPFRTTTMQQEASRKLSLSSSQTMQVAQRLYENGFITYMRTDSTQLSDTALDAARRQVRELYGGEFLPEAPRTYATKVKNAQEAHEAIRPSGDTFATPAQTGLTGEQFRLYELIWKRTVASQMKDATGQSVQVRLGGAASSGEDVVLTANGRVITFHGFLRAYVEGTDEEGASADDEQSRLPALQQGETVTSASLTPEGHETKPPARYTEATLIRELEEREIGRPSTYASILGTILGRGYVYKKSSALVPAWLAFSVVRLLEEHFPRQISYEFTAHMEDALDGIAAGERDRTAELAEFYFGAGDQEGLKSLVEGLGEIDARELATFPVHEDDGSDSGIVLRVGRYGPYLDGPDPKHTGSTDGAADENGPATVRANVPEDLPPDELSAAKARELLATPAGDERELGRHPDTGLLVVARNGRFGPYVREELPEDAPKSQKARTSSLFQSMSLDTVTLEDAVRLLSLPRTVGEDAEGTPITAQNGRYGPYLKKGTDSRSLETEEQIFQVTLDEALALYAQPKRRGRQQSSAPLKELGTDPASGGAVVVKDGRFGPYVTDGEHNASLRQADSVEEVTLERAAELLAERRAKAPAKKSAAKKGAAKKSTQKTAGAKKSTQQKSTQKKSSTSTAKKSQTSKSGPAKKSAAKKGTSPKSSGEQGSGDGSGPPD